VVKD